MTKRKAYDREVVISKLKRMKGVSLKFEDNELSFITIEAKANLGIKMLGQIDSLRTHIYRKEEVKK